MLIGRTVSLRPVEKSDAPLLAQWLNDPRTYDLAEGRWPVRQADLEARLAKNPNYDKRGEFLVVLTDTVYTDHEIAVGHLRFLVPSAIPARHCFEIAFGIHPDHRRKGYATMAGRLLVNQLFNATAVYRVQGHCLTDNVASQGVMEGVGMKREAILRGYAYRAGTHADVCIYSILRPEWGDQNAYAERFGGL